MTRKREEFRVDLFDEDITNFHSIKARNNIRKNIDVFRHCLRTTYQLEKDGDIPYSALPNELKDDIQKILLRDDIKSKFMVYSLDDVIRQGVQILLEEMRSYQLQQSLFNWDTRSNLNGEQKDVAMAIYECQKNSDTNDVTVETILDELKWRNRKLLEEILDEFVYINLVEMDIVNGIKRYHAI